MLFEVTIRYLANLLVEVLVEAAISCAISLMRKLAFQDLKFGLGITTEGWRAIDWGCRLFSLLDFRSGSGWRFVE